MIFFGCAFLRQPKRRGGPRHASKRLGVHALGARGSGKNSGHIARRDRSLSSVVAFGSSRSKPPPTAAFLLSLGNRGLKEEREKRNRRSLGCRIADVTRTLRKVGASEQREVAPVDVCRGKRLVTSLKVGRTRGRRRVTGPTRVTTQSTLGRPSSTRALQPIAHCEETWHLLPDRGLRGAEAAKAQALDHYLALPSWLEWTAGRLDGGLALSAAA